MGELSSSELDRQCRRRGTIGQSSTTLGPTRLAFRKPLVRLSADALAALPEHMSDRSSGANSREFSESQYDESESDISENSESENERVRTTSESASNASRRNSGESSVRRSSLQEW